MALGMGSIAFVGFNADGADNLAFVVLEPIAAGTVIHFTDNEWTGSAFNTGESTWSWTATSDIAAGSVVSLDSLASGTATSNLGTIAFSETTQRDISISDEIVYAYVGTPTAPTAFLAAVSNDALTTGATLSGTGLVAGQTALTLTAKDADADIAQYTGVTTGRPSYADYLTFINNPANWTTQDASGNQDHDGIAPDVPFTVPALTIDPTAQLVNFAASSLNVTQAEGNSGVTLYSFTVERSLTAGDLTFSGTIGGTTDGVDFGGSKPLTFTGVIADGATSATVTIAITSDITFEIDETVILTLTSAQNRAASALLGTSLVRTVTLTNDDPYTIHNGELVTGAITVPAGQALIVEQGGAIQGDVILNNPGVLPSVVNSGTMKSAAQAIQIGNSNALDFTGGITIVNNAGALIEGGTRGMRATADFHGSTVTIDNAGTIRGVSDNALRLDDALNGKFVVNNAAGGLIETIAAGSDVLRVGNNTTINNAGTIRNGPDLPNASRAGDGVDFKASTGGVLHNLAGGYIEASRHAVTGERGLTVINDLGGLMVGRNGSAVNMDNDSSVANTVFVTNHGVMRGESAHYADSDGDAIDTDGLAVIDNYGTIEGLGHNGYHDGEPNVSEGIAIGGGVINNYAGGTIYGYGRAIEIDNSSNGPAFAATTVYNEGLIKGDGQAPTEVTQAEIDLFVARIKGGEAINFLGDFDDTVTNAATGQIIGGTKMGGGVDSFINNGTVTATGGSAVDTGDGNDSVTNDGTITGSVLLGTGNDLLHNAGKITGTIDGGDGIDTAVYEDGAVKVDLLLGTASHGGRIDTLVGFENVTTGAGADQINGSDLANVLDGGAGDDKINGNGGDDLLIGGLGRDTLNGGAGIDTASYENASSSVAADLSTKKGTFGEAIGDKYVGIENLTGSAHDDALFGDNFANVLSGGAGNDHLEGLLGNDTLNGGAGDDLLIGGTGVDLLSGGEGADTFVFAKADSGKTLDKADTILDFVSGLDKIDLSAIDANAKTADVFEHFSFIGSAAFSKVAGQLHYEVSGSDVIVSGDFNGDAKADFMIQLHGISSLSAGDFIL
ncbi:M10 family metallopeptidase C-terminal domain-containing protein [Novosphingobium sp. G106]|uniref:calcium-binding protein n=1 Tax=Novosphingobium sp. G106 TaxID=2849500 RepID=UPI001C2DE7BF|nr:calcium-binding protein [Novosphingobium sp. G106]MBV1689383.1 M10 family metallopeptidase C-terminal domain-containing protein [Novosphingobium sp. G106]